MSAVRRKLFACALSSLTLAGCDGKSDATGELVPFDKVCAYEKWKDVAFEGYFGIRRVSCRGMKSQKSGRTLTQECSVAMYAAPGETGSPISVWIEGIDGDKKFNKIAPPPANYRADDFKVYDNEQQLIPLGSRVRVTGSLRKTDACELSAARFDVAR